MQQRGKRMAALALAAAVCLLVPAAGANAEPWTYEVDSEMSGYGVEYYSDVGLEAPTRRADTTQSTAAGQGTTARTDAGISTYSAAGEGRSAVSPYVVESWDTYAARLAVTEAALQSTQTDAYTITIPADLTIEESGTGSMNVSGTVQPYHELTIEVSPENGMLKNGEDTIAYSIDGDFAAENSADSKWTASADADASEVSFIKNLSATVDENAVPTLAGEYTDTLSFTMSCRQKQFTIVYDANDGEGNPITKTYACGTSEVLAPKPDAFSKEGYSFTGWATAKTDAPKIYSQGMPLSQMDAEDDVSTKDGATLTLYAQWVETATTNTYTVEVYYESINSVNGTNVNTHTYDNAIERTFENTYLMPGVTYKWTLDELVERGIVESSEKDAFDETTYYDVKVPEKDATDQKIKIYVNRKLIWLDLNGALQNEDGTYRNELNITEWGTATIIVNGITKADSTTDYWKVHTYGSHIQYKVTANTGYEVIGYKLRSSTNQPIMFENPAKTQTIDLPSLNEYNNSQDYTRSYGIWPIFKKTTTTTEITDTLLPDTDTTTPVVTQPTDDTAADDDTTADADDTQDKATTPTRDLSTPVVVDLPADDTARADTGKTAADTTPEELMLQDTDELLASFALSDPEELNLTE